MRSKRFLSHLILTLSWCLKNNIRSRWEKFAVSYNPFFRVVQITILTAQKSRGTPHASHSETEAECCLQRNQRRAVRATWVRCEPSAPRRDPRTNERSNELAVVEGVLSRFFQTPAAAIQSDMSARPALKFKPRKSNAFRISRQRSENSELFKKPEPCAQFQWERTSFAVQPRRSLRGSEMVPTTCSWCSSFRGRESHWTQKGYEGPHGIRGKTVHRLSASSTFSLGIWLEARKNPTRLSSPHDVPQQGSA